MAHDGTAGVSPEGWLPDRVALGVLIRSFPPHLVDRVISATEAHEERRRRLPARLVMYFVLALWLFRGPNCGYGRVMTKLVAGLSPRLRAEVCPASGRPGRQVATGTGDTAGDRTGAWQQPNVSSLSRARAKLGPDPVRHLFEQVAGPVAIAGAAGTWAYGLRVVSMDGATCEVPDTDDNRSAFGDPGTGPGDGAYPRVRWVVAVESGTGALLEAAIGASTTAERVLARDLLAALTPGMLVLADHSFLSHALARDVLATGAHILWRAPARTALRPVRVLPDGTHLARLRPVRTADGGPITVRVIDASVDATAVGPAPVGPAPATAERRAEPGALVTDLLDPGAHPALDLAGVYAMRRGAETVIGHHRSMGPGQPALRSKDPEGVAQEMWALFAVHQALGPLIDTGVRECLPNGSGTGSPATR